MGSSSQAKQVAPSPFHEGEQQIQSFYGIQEQIDAWGRKVIRGYMPYQHRESYEMLPFLLAGTVDAQGRPWASILVGQPGFVTSPDPEQLEIRTKFIYGDPIRENLKASSSIGLLGIQLSTRRRNRMNGRVKPLATTENESHFLVQVEQSFGNCPKYIQTRDVQVLQPALCQVDAPKEVIRLKNQPLNEDQKRFISERADAFYIASAYPSISNGNNKGTAAPPSHGIDVSHRGGKPGFILAHDTPSTGGRTLTTLLFPDYRGNNHYNTLGNLVLNPQCGLLFLDFATGDTIQISGRAEKVILGKTEEEKELIALVPGAQRLVAVTVDEVVHIKRALPFTGTFMEYSPALEFKDAEGKPIDNTLTEEVRQKLWSSSVLMSIGKRSNNSNNGNSNSNSRVSKYGWITNKTTAGTAAAIAVAVAVAVVSHWLGPITFLQLV